MNIFFWKKKSKLETYGPIVLIGLFIALVILLNIQNPITFENIKKIHATVLHYVNNHYLLFTVLLFVSYVISICLVIPDSILISLLAGTIYPLPGAIVFIALSETVGAFAFYWIVRLAFREYFLKKEAVLHEKLARGFSDHDASYLLFFRFSHILPFWLINVIAVLFKTGPWTFLWTTFIGMIPFALILAQAGHSLEKALLTDTHFSLQTIFNKETDLTLLGLGILALLPIVFKKIFKIYK